MKKIIIIFCLIHLSTCIINSSEQNYENKYNNKYLSFNIEKSYTPVKINDPLNTDYGNNNKMNSILAGTMLGAAILTILGIVSCVIGGALIGTYAFQSNTMSNTVFFNDLYQNSNYALLAGAIVCFSLAGILFIAGIIMWCVYGYLWSRTKNMKRSKVDGLSICIKL